MKLFFKSFIIFMMSLCLSACAPKRNDYSEFSSIDAKGWAYGDTISFTVTHADSIASGDLILSLRHTDEYLYSNLWLLVSYTDDQNHRFNDKININLADVYGNWTGKGTSISFQKQIVVKKGLRHVCGQQVKVAHIMRTDTLGGIELLGIDFVSLDKE